MKPAVRQILQLRQAILNLAVRGKLLVPQDPAGCGQVDRPTKPSLARLGTSRSQRKSAAPVPAPPHGVFVYQQWR